MKTRLRTYTAYSIGCAAAWAVILIVTSTRGSETDHIRLVFGGWVVGWLSASIARVVYPPPKSGWSTGTSS